MNALWEYETARVESILGARFGLDEETLGSGSLEQALRKRLADTDTESMQAYVERLARDKAEQQTFVEQLLVPETWFFRDVLPFECLRRFVAEDWRPTKEGRTLRVLSVPCSTGEEPYSIAMTLLDGGYDAASLHIDGVDLSRSFLAKASKGIYSKSAIRGDEHQYSEVLRGGLAKDGDYFFVKPEIRKPVRFQCANLSAPDFLSHEATYDVIFCRNVLIYFHAKARQTAIANLHRLLSPGGLLYVGHVEAAIIAEGPFRSLDSFPFAFRPVDGKDTRCGNEYKKTRNVVAPRPGKTESKPPTIDDLGLSPKPTKPSMPIESAPGKSEEELLKSAREAADSGRLQEAESVCLSVLAKSPTSAEAFCLLGQINQAQDDILAAEKHFHKALYLSPQHHQSLVHLMLIAQQRGDQPSAANYRRRARQAELMGGDP